MNQQTRVLFFIMTMSIFFFSACDEQDELKQDLLPQSLKTTPYEDFESGSKTAYAAASVSLGSGNWYFDDALLGSLSSDRKFDSKSVRVRNSGKLTMQFNKTNGAGTLSIYHAKYGNDGSSTWALYASSDGGYSWIKIGNTITTSSTTLQEQVFTINESSNVRFEIRKLSGGSYRINFDNLNITDFSDGGEEPPAPIEDDNHLLLGNPSNAVLSIVSANNYLMNKEFYSIGYSNQKLTPIWVSWHLSESDFGTAPRQNDFRADNDLPISWYHVSSTEYSGSGFDRGHMCPSGDRKSSIEANSSTFLMTNMIPQSPNNNRVTWVALENYARTLVDNGKELYIISGPSGQGGTGSNGFANTLGNGVVVPAYTWKIIVVLDNGVNDLSRISNSTRVIAVYMPNNQDVNDLKWYNYRVSIDYIESQTGFDFLSNVSSSLQNTLEAYVDNVSI